MSIQKVSYEDKVDLQIWASIPNTNKIKAEDMNGIKKAINGNADELSKSQKDITSQNKQLQILTNALPSETQEGESINIKGTIPAKFKEFVVKGNSKQETRSGKNIVNINSADIVNANTTIEVENNTLTVTGSSTTNFYSAIPIKLKPNTDYSISTLATVVEQNGLSQSAYIRVRSDLSGSWIGDSILINKDLTTQQNLKGTFNSGDNENAYLILYLSPLNDATQRSAKIEFENLQIEEGTQATDYEPYGAMPSPEYPSEIQNVEGNVNVTVANKNTLKNDIENQTINDVTITKNEDGTLTLNGIATRNMWIEFTTNLKVSKGDNVLSLRNKISGLGLYLGSEANTDYAITQATTTEEKAFKLQENTVFDVVRLRIMEGTVFNNLTVYPMLEKNTIGTDYVPHQEQTVTFPLSEGQKLMLGDYLATDGIHHKRKQIELDGTENIIVNQATYNVFKINNINDIGNNGSTTTLNDYLCTHFKEYTQVQLRQGNIGFAALGGEVNAIYLGFGANSEVNSVEACKSFLSQQKQAGTPVIVEYELTEEEIEAYTEEQQTVYNQICNLNVYEEETNIFSTNEISPIFKVTAVKDVNSVITQLNQLILEGGK